MALACISSWLQNGVQAEDVIVVAVGEDDEVETVAVRVQMWSIKVLMFSLPVLVMGLGCDVPHPVSVTMRMLACRPSGRVSECFLT